MSLLNYIYPLLKPFLFKLDAEKAHHLTLSLLQRAAKQSFLRSLVRCKTAEQPRRVMGLLFPNCVGLAAGLDKDARYLNGLDLLGFGFIEIGTLTLRPQAGNDTPRLFRLPQAHALINRMGFNNAGVDAAIAAIKNSNYKGILGINIGKNKDTPLQDAPAEYVQCFEKVYAYADYITVNISSPNTAQLRDLQQGEHLKDLLTQLKQAQEKLSFKHAKYVPIVVKVAPDLEDAAIEEIAKILLDLDIDGLIATNTTLAREKVAHLPHGQEAGGLSGQPLTAQNTEIVKKFAKLFQQRIAVIAAGGIMSAADAEQKLQAGADLVQIYTGFIYKGPRLIKEINQLSKCN